MTADTTVVVYKREPLPQILSDESILNYCGDEFQRIENVLNRHDQAVQNVSTEVDTNNGTAIQGIATANGTIASLTSTVAGNTSAISSEATTRATEDSALATLITNLTATVSSNQSTNSAAISSEATARANADSALATLITNLTATVSSNQSTNSAAISSEATARANADSAAAKIQNTLRAINGAAVSDTWESGKSYNGGVDGNGDATGDEVVVNPYIYRCKSSHTSSNSNKPPNSTYWQAIDTVDAKIAAGVTTASNAHTTAGYAMASDLTALTSRVSTVDGIDASGVQQNAGDVYSLSQTIATNDSVVSDSLDVVSARFGVTVSDNYDNSRAYQVKDEVIYNTLIYRCTATSTGNIPTNTSYWALQDAVPGIVNAAVAVEATARATQDAALAGQISGVSASVGAVSASVTTEAQARVAADNTISTRYGVELNANGYVTGFKQINDGSSGTFKILADKFLVVDPSANAGVAGEQVFVIESGQVKMDAAFIKDLTVDNLEGDVNTITYFSSSGSRTFGGTSAGYVELTTVDCAANTAGKAHRATLNMIFSGRFENDTAEVKVEVATLTGGSPGTYATIQSLEHFCGGVNGANTTIPVIAAMSSDTTSAVRFRISVKMWGDQGNPNTTSASNTGTAKWRGYTVGLT